MNNKLVNESGNQYGSLFVKFHTGKGWHCICSCGNSIIVSGRDLRKGDKMSCGCKKDNTVDHTGKEFGDYICVGRVEDSRYWEFKCVHGKKRLKKRSGRFSSLLTVSCNCHVGHSSLPSREYSSWCGMKQRCDNPNIHNYSSYGGRGIRYCESWSSFENFYRDMGDRPEGCTLDRIDVDGDYCPENCRWATFVEQRANQRG